MDKKLADKAAKWWADQLRSPAKLDNGDKSPTGAMTSFLALMCQDAERSGLSDDKIQKFETELSRILQERAEDWVSFGVDYHPDYEIIQACEKSGINPGLATFPWKTQMYINKGQVSVACGYGASAEILA